VTDPPKVGELRVLLFRVCVSLRVTNRFAAIPSSEEVGAVVEDGTAGMMSPEENGPDTVGHPYTYASSVCGFAVGQAAKTAVENRAEKRTPPTVKIFLIPVLY
jgi:hypothetical protein